MCNPKISVIIPVYNVEDYLEDTLRSLINQTIFEDIEVLMVDDGSTDNSRYIIEKYSLDYDNFYAYHKVNEGQGVARNYALNLAKGEYVIFLDSDDYISSNALEVLYENALKNGSDIVICDVLRFGPNTTWGDTLFKHSFEGIDEDVESTTLNEYPQLLWDTSTSNKIYKKDFLEKNGIHFPYEKIFFEDLLFSLETLINADSIYLSKEIFYFWRFRNKKTSVTQQNQNTVNFKDRMKILRLSDQMMKNYGVGDKIIFEEYRKWLNHDLRIFINKVNNYPVEFHQEFVDEIKDILRIIPEEFFMELNSYKKVIYQMIKNNDTDALLDFAPMEKELMANPSIPDKLSDEYINIIDFKSDSVDEELVADVVGIDCDDENLIIEFKEQVNYLGLNYPHETSIVLIDSDESELPIQTESNTFKIPISLVKDKTHLKIKVIYECDKFVKECYLRYKKRNLFVFNNIEVNVNYGLKSILYLDLINRKDSNIELNDVTFDGSQFTFKGKSKYGLNQISIKNVLSFDEIDYSVNGECDEFEFEIPYVDIFKSPITKWEVFPETLQLSGQYMFFDAYHKIKIDNIRDKILIQVDVANSIDELEKVSDKLSKANSKNKELKQLNRQYKQENKKLNKINTKLEKKNVKLIDKNENLKNKVNEYQSRKDVRIVDKLKSIM